jgi:hypothetical protein
MRDGPQEEPSPRRGSTDVDIVTLPTKQQARGAFETEKLNVWLRPWGMEMDVCREDMPKSNATTLTTT